MKAYEFEMGGDATVSEGKLQWPDFLHIWMKPQDAWRLVDTLQRQLRAGEQEIEVSGPGKLRKVT